MRRSLQFIRREKKRACVTRHPLEQQSSKIHPVPRPVRPQASPSSRTKNFYAVTHSVNDSSFRMQKCFIEIVIPLELTF